MKLELVPDDRPEAEKSEAVIPLGYDPQNSADRLHPDERYFLVDAVAEQERRQKLQDISGLPKHSIDWVNSFCAT
ncbi:MAG: hypothetical protein KAJ55_17115 [Anaerolineales bacterium]|nr:hypothetical protein [Anaerolineales bacterium]